MIIGIQHDCISYYCSVDGILSTMYMLFYQLCMLSVCLLYIFFLSNCSRPSTRETNWAHDRGKILFQLMKAHLAYESNVRGCSSGEEDNNSGFSVHPTHRILVLEWVSQWYNFLVPLFSVEHLSSFMSCLEDLEYIMESNCKSFKDYLFKDFGTPPDPTHSLSSTLLFLIPSSFVILAFLLPLPS